MPEEQERKLATMKKLDAILEQMGINGLDDFTLNIMTIDSLPEAIKQNVITSYSIHYTKLYERP